MKTSSWKTDLIFFLFIFLLFGCEDQTNDLFKLQNPLPDNILDYSGTPDSPTDRSSLAFSDQGAWFAYGFPDEKEIQEGFAGPFLMTQQNGVWSSPELSILKIRDPESGAPYYWNECEKKSYNSHLWQTLKNESVEIEQTLFFASAHSVVIQTRIINTSIEKQKLTLSWNGSLFNTGLRFSKWPNGIKINSDKSEAEGYIWIFNDPFKVGSMSDSLYSIELNPIELDIGESMDFLLAHTFLFPEYDAVEEQKNLEIVAVNFDSALQSRIDSKTTQLKKLFKKKRNFLNEHQSEQVISKAVLTMQNNWRIPSGELKHSGLFPSYHYIWFHGFWAWDSWKHAVALSQYDTELAKEQIRAMYDFMDEKGFIADCIYRDTTIEAHNYRNTKPPLSAWATWKVYEQDQDSRFLEEIYPQILKQHRWWYENRDHDQDGICEYGSTDGSLIAAKWESGMDNAVRFDDSKILKNSPTAWSLNQESVDLNAYLYAEKIFLSKMAEVLQKDEDQLDLKTEADKLKLKIQHQFYDAESGWFYDTSIDGKPFIKAKGCEGWIPLWANVATAEQAESIKNIMIDPVHFNTHVPFQTFDAAHPDFKPDGGYWRGPNWLDQAYFGIKGLRNYGYNKEANEATLKLIQNAEGVLEKGKSIRENYNPITGEGLEAENFSWSAAHYLLLLINE